MLGALPHPVSPDNIPRQQAKTQAASSLGKRLLLRRTPKKPSKDAGSQSVRATVVSQRWLAIGLCSMAEVLAPVSIVNVSVTGPDPAAIVKLFGANVQETCAGSCPHENVTVPA